MAETNGQNQQVGKSRFPTESWQYDLEIRHKGSRSESWIGKLKTNGKLIEGKKEGEVIETPLGKFKWFGKAPPHDLKSYKNGGWLARFPSGASVFDLDKKPRK